MNLLDFFEPVKYSEIINSVLEFNDTLASQIHVSMQLNLEEYDVAIIGIEDAVNAPYNIGCANAPSKVRKEFVNLSKTSRHLNIIDLGNLKGSSINDKYFAFQEVAKYLKKASVRIFFIGGTQDYLIPLLKELQEDDNPCSLSLIDSKIDYSSKIENFTSETFLNQLVEYARPDTELNVIGVQKYFLGKTQEDWLNDQKWNYIRLKDVKEESVTQIEPYLRDSTVMCFDANAINNSSIVSYNGANINGFSALESCKTMWYAGLSLFLKAVGLVEYNPELNNRSANMLMAQMCWHYFEGMSHKMKDIPLKNSADFKISVVHLDEFDIDVRFYKNKITNRWWIEIPNENTERLVSCSEEDYKAATNGELMPRWWQWFGVAT